MIFARLLLLLLAIWCFSVAGSCGGVPQWAPWLQYKAQAPLEPQSACGRCKCLVFPMAALGPPAVAQGVGSSKGKSRPALPVAPPARDPLADNDDDELLGDAINQFVDRDRKRAHLLEAAGSAAASSIGASGSAALESMREDIDNRETRQRMLRGTARLFHQRAASFQQNFLSQLTSQIAGQLDAQAEAVVAARLQSMLAAVSRSFELRMDQRESRFGCSHRWSRLAAVGQRRRAGPDRSPPRGHRCWRRSRPWLGAHPGQRRLRPPSRPHDPAHQHAAHHFRRVALPAPTAAAL